MSEPELLPCPFCGGLNIQVRKAASTFYAHCLDCKADGPPTNRSSIKDAPQFWNIRQAPLSRRSQGGGK